MSDPEVGAKEELMKSLEAVTLKRRLQSAGEGETNGDVFSLSSSSSGSLSEAFQVAQGQNEPAKSSGIVEERKPAQTWRQSHSTDSKVPPIVDSPQVAQSPPETVKDFRSVLNSRGKEPPSSQGRQWTVVEIKQAPETKREPEFKGSFIQKKPPPPPKPKLPKFPNHNNKGKLKADSPQIHRAAKSEGHEPFKVEVQKVSSDYEELDQNKEAEKSVLHLGKGSVKSRASMFEGSGRVIEYAVPDMSKKSKRTSYIQEKPGASNEVKDQEEEEPPSIPLRLYLDDAPTSSSAPDSPPYKDSGPPSFKPPPPPVMNEQSKQQQKTPSSPAQSKRSSTSHSPPPSFRPPPPPSDKDLRNVSRRNQPPVPPSPFQDRRSSPKNSNGPPNFKPSPPSGMKVSDEYEEVIVKKKSEVLSSEDPYSVISSPVKPPLVDLYSSVDVVSAIPEAPGNDTNEQVPSGDGIYDEVVVRKPPVKPPPYKPTSIKQKQEGFLSSNAIPAAPSESDVESTNVIKPSVSERMSSLSNQNSPKNIAPLPDITSSTYSEVQPSAYVTVSGTSTPPISTNGKSTKAKPPPPPRISSIKDDEPPSRGNSRPSSAGRPSNYLHEHELESLGSVGIPEKFIDNNNMIFIDEVPDRGSALKQKPALPPKPVRLEDKSENMKLPTAPDMIPERDTGLLSGPPKTKTPVPAKLSYSALLPRAFGVRAASITDRDNSPSVNGLGSLTIVPPPPVDLTFESRMLNDSVNTVNSDPLSFSIVPPPPKDEGLESEYHPTPVKGLHGFSPVTYPSSSGLPRTSDLFIPVVPPPPSHGPPPLMPSEEPPDFDFDIVPSPYINDNVHSSPTMPVAPLQLPHMEDAEATSDEEDFLPPPPLPPTGRYVGVHPPPPLPPSAFEEKRLQPLVPSLRKHR